MMLSFECPDLGPRGFVTNRASGRDAIKEDSPDSRGSPWADHHSEMTGWPKNWRFPSGGGEPSMSAD
jgi:hypothetical protein